MVKPDKTKTMYIGFPAHLQKPSAALSIRRTEWHLRKEQPLANSHTLYSEPEQTLETDYVPGLVHTKPEQRGRLDLLFGPRLSVVSHQESGISPRGAQRRRRCSVWTATVCPGSSMTPPAQKGLQRRCGARSLTRCPRPRRGIREVVPKVPSRAFSTQRRRLGGL